MKSNARRMILFLILFIGANTDFAQSTLFLNPGLKFGYAFGKNGSFIFGAELSVVYWSSDRSALYYGAVISAEVGKHIGVYHFGIELGTPFGELKQDRHF